MVNAIGVILKGSKKANKGRKYNSNTLRIGIIGLKIGSTK